MFDFEWTRDRLGRVRNLLWALVACALVGFYFFWDHAQVLIHLGEPIFKVIGFVIGPLFAIIGFFTTKLDKIEIAEQAGELSAAKVAADAAKNDADAARDQAEQRTQQAEKLHRELKGITEGADTLWKLRPPREFPLYRGWYHAEGAKFVSIGNLKGGVGKTTIAANFAAYASEVLHKDVLVIDLDYQGSLSNMLLTAFGREDITDSRVDALFSKDADLVTLQQARVQMVPRSGDYSTTVSRGWFVPTGLSFARLENSMLLDWLLDHSDAIDVRYRLAHLLLSPEVRHDYDLVIFDLPPRMTLGAINALIASHSFFVPTLLDGLSVEAIPQMVKTIANLRQDLDLGIKFGGVIGTMTLHDGMGKKEESSAFDATEKATAAWAATGAPLPDPIVIPRTLPRRVSFSDVAGNDIALLKSNNDGIKDIMHTLFEDMSKRIGLI